jgi:LDH2 family malate/lactate/ureidoglycolate dehydrogenase
MRGVEDVITFQAEELHDIATRIFQAAGSDPEPTAILVDHLIDANLAGHDSHGVQHIPGYVKAMQSGAIQPNARPELLRETPVSALVDGKFTFGQVSTRYGADVTIRKARAGGVAVVGVVRGNHIGRLGTYPTLASREGVFLTVAIGSLSPHVAPFGGRTGVFGTNPFSFGFPAANQPDVLVDFATSAVAAGKLGVAQAKHEQMAPGILIDREGNPTTDPRALSEGGAILPAGGHKGTGLAVISVLLSQILVPATDTGEGHFQTGTFLLGIDVGIFRDRAAVEAEADGIIEKIKAVPPARGFEEVLVPGEPELRSAERRRREGIPVPEDTWAEIVATARSLDVALPARS